MQFETQSQTGEVRKLRHLPPPPPVSKLFQGHCRDSGVPLPTKDTDAQPGYTQAATPNTRTPHGIRQQGWMGQRKAGAKSTHIPAHKCVRTHTHTHEKNIFFFTYNEGGANESNTVVLPKGLAKVLCGDGSGRCCVLSVQAHPF